MVSELFKFSVHSNPNDLIDITENVEEFCGKTEIKNGTVTIYCPGSTAGISTLEYEPGLVKFDVPKLLQKLMPEGPDYIHHQTWHDHNGHSHLRSFMIPPSFSVPIVEGKLLRGTWQQLVFCEFDEKSRLRTIYCQFVG
jgi:secondary thiamine-phosphate synthase enzyme